MEKEITYSMFEDAYKDGLINKSKLNCIREVYGKIKRRVLYLDIHGDLNNEHLIRSILGMKYRLKKNMKIFTRSGIKSCH